MSEWTSGQVVTETLANQKFVLVQAAAPSTAYEGQVWSCTSSNPLLVKSYDDTNTQWMEHRPRTYEAVSDLKTQPRLNGVPVLNGSLFIHYSTSGAQTRLLMRSNNRFWGLEG